jgi:uncharacterized tellurite resistance protein B-like protein
MTTLTLTRYPDDSPEAMLRVLAMFVISDGEVANEEIDSIERLGLLDALGGDRNRFAEVIAHYCDDLIAHAEGEANVGLVDPDWVDAVLAPVRDAGRRRLLAQALLVVARSDGYFADAELVVVRRALERWGLDLDSLG